MGKKILVVEDERNIVDILTFNLQREGYDTLEALDGAAGLRLALDQDPDLILLDLMLPKMDGFQVCRTLRDQGRATPIIMLTAREEETDKVLGLELGADDYITKPFSMRELMARVKANIRRTAMAAAAAKPGSRPRSGPTAQPKVAPIKRVGTISPPQKPAPTHRAVSSSFTAKAQGSVSPATARSIMCAPAPA